MGLSTKHEETYLHFGDDDTDFDDPDDESGNDDFDEDY